VSNAVDRIDEIFWEASHLAPGGPRDAYLARACGEDRRLRRRVEKLLRVQPQVERFLERPFAGPAATADWPAACEGPGTVVGPYKLLEQIGEGGMGLVFMAEQQQPLRRKVALKVLKPGMDTRQVIARFEAERQALALMDHPNIAKVHDAGTTATGRPYFVMELVRGVPITEFCDQRRLTTRQRLVLFVTVCQAVQHAHQKGIIHRDLKPSNVLVTLHDTVAVPKVIDFGIAKATGQQLTERTLFTHFAQFVGTPLYVSPEQAEMNGLDVDTRSDVYALGVLLYELLTGTTPFESETLKKVGYDEMRRIIREEEPPTPSQRLSTLEAKACLTVSVQRGVDGRRLGQVLRGELDWIVMKALEKDRNRRYESASALAADVQRYLNDEPVEACPPSAGYRLRKYVRRNGRALVMGGLFAAVLMSATVVSVWQAKQARDALSQAETDRDRAEASQRQADAISDFLQNDLLLQVEGDAQREAGFSAEPELTVRQALDRAAARIGDRFPDQPLVEAALRRTIGRVYQHLGEESSISHLERAVELFQAHLGPDHPETLRSQTELAWAYQRDRMPDALALFEQVFDRYEKTHGSHHQDTLFALNNLGEACRKAGQLERAARIIKRALERKVTALGPDHRRTVQSVHDLGLVYLDMGRYEEAVPLLEEAAAKRTICLGADHGETVLSRLNLAEAYGLVGKLDAASRLLREEIRRPDSQGESGRLQSASQRVMLAHYLIKQSQFAEAEAVLAEALARYEQLSTPSSPRRFLPRRFQAMSLLGEVLTARGQYNKAEPLLLEGYEGLRQIPPKRRPSENDWAAEAAGRLARLYETTGEASKARAWREKASAR
jgi:non-specific serine/threonine protein kinase/serine/threonine-protein kinase